MKANTINIRHQLLKGLLLATFTSFGSTAHADLLIQHSGSITGQTEYNSNLQFLPRDAESTYIYRILPTYKLAAVDGTNEIFGTIGFNFQKSSNSRISNDREDPSVNLGWKRLLQSGYLDFNASYVKQSSRITQLTQTGVVAADGTSVTKEYSANWVNNLTSRLTLDMLGAYRENTFSGVGLGGFDERQLQAELQYEYNEKYSPFLRISANDFRSLSRFEYQTALVGSNVTLGASSSIKAGLGVTHFSSDGENEGVGFIDYDYVGSRSAATVSLSRSVFPTGLNLVEIGDALKILYSYELSYKSKVGGILSATQNLRQKLDTQRAGLFYTYEISPQLLMRMDMSFDNLTGLQDKSVHNDQIGISITYNTENF